MLASRKHFGSEFEDIYRTFVMILQKRPKMDFYESATELEALLKEAGFTQGAHKFMGKMLEELEDPQSSWRPNYGHLLEPLFSILPPDWVKRRVSDDIIVKHVPYSEWHHYRDDNWVKDRMAERSKLARK